jgi:hypothetical protein
MLVAWAGGGKNLAPNVVFIGSGQFFFNLFFRFFYCFGNNPVLFIVDFHKER